jgi:TetR/AcrR family transcriptional repressor of uid operon
MSQHEHRSDAPGRKSAMIPKRHPHTKKKSRTAKKIRRGAKPVESTRERILTAAAALFAEHGFEGSPMPAIARVSGITAGAIYKHFKSKGELLLEVVKRSFESTPLFIQNATTGAATELPRLASVYTELELKLVRQLSIEVHAAASRDSEVRRVLALSDEAAMQYISDAIALAQREGKLDPKLNPDFAARLFCVFVMGLLHMDTLLPNLIGDKSWRDFVHERIAALIGAA